MFHISSAVSIGLFISLSIYVNAFSEEFKAIISDVNDEIDSNNKKSLKLCVNKIDSFSKLTQAILLQNEMFKYIFVNLFKIEINSNSCFSIFYSQTFGKHPKFNKREYI